MANYDLTPAFDGFPFPFVRRCLTARRRPPEFVSILMNPDIAYGLSDSCHQVEPTRGCRLGRLFSCRSGIVSHAAGDVALPVIRLPIFLGVDGVDGRDCSAFPTGRPFVVLSAEICDVDIHRDSTCSFALICSDLLAWKAVLGRMSQKLCNIEIYVIPLT
jgi:hypothetical protein